MTRKHFVEMASSFKIILAGAKGKEARNAVIDCIESFMSVAACTNGQFDRNRFRTACGL